jgi:hypothetical protein
VDEGLKQDKDFEGNEEKLNLEITSESRFTMQFEGQENKEEYDPKNVRCVPKSNPIVKPVAWKITEGGMKGGNLLVFHMLPERATVKHAGSKITDKHPSKPKCNLFVRFVSFYINFC